MGLRDFSVTLLAVCVGTHMLSPVEATTFSVKQVAVAKHAAKAPPMVAMQAFEKFAKHGAAAPPSLASAASAAASKQTGTVSAEPDPNDVSYLSPVDIGGQTFMLDFDTGSADLWVFSTLTPKVQVNGQALYNPKKSPNAKRLKGYTWEISYGDGSGAEGVVFLDTVKVGGVTATSQAVEAATAVSRTFANDESTDGLLGLAFPSINTVMPKSQKTFFGTVASSLKSKLFTTDLKDGAAGTYDFGFIDQSKYSGDISYVPVNSTAGFWTINVGSFAVGDYATYNISTADVSAAGKVGEAIVDTGTTLLYLPDQLVSNYYSAVKGSKLNYNQGGWVYPCKSNLPSLGVSIGNGFFTVPGTYINFGAVSKGSKMCFGGLQSSKGLPFSILGDVFLKAQFVVFDQTQAKPRIGMASKLT